MQFQDYRLADIQNNAKLVEHISKLEKDLSEDLGDNIVLVAYQKNAIVMD